jgi:hypothetical protein
MFTRPPRPAPHQQAPARQPAARLRRLAAILTALTGALLASAAAIPAAVAKMLPDGGPPYTQDLPGAQVPAQIHTVTGGGMPGWQITLIAAGAAILAALLAVTAHRARAARRHVPAPNL